MSLKIIDQKIATFTANAEKVNLLCHEIGMMILRHAQEHGDCTRAQKLVMAMPASMRRTMLIAWFSAYSPIVTKVSGEWTAKMHKPDTKLFVPFDIEAADANPFYKMAEETPEKVFDFEAILKMVERLAKQIDKRIEDGKVPEEDIESAKAASRAISGLHLERIKAEAKNDDKPEKPAKPVDGNVEAFPKAANG